jgi:hypothetical protein
VNEYLKKLMELLGLPQEEATAKLRELMITHPDEAERLAAIETLIRSYATPAIEALPNTVAGLIRDIATGQTGVDPDAWAGSG